MIFDIFNSKMQNSVYFRNKDEKRGNLFRCVVAVFLAAIQHILEFGQEENLKFWRCLLLLQSFLLSPSSFQPLPAAKFNEEA